MITPIQAQTRLPSTILPTVTQTRPDMQSMFDNVWRCVTILFRDQTALWWRFWQMSKFQVETIYFLESLEEINYINSHLPLGRYINMDPTPTELLISQTQLIWFGQFLGGWICNNQLHLPSIIAENMQFQQCSQENFVIDIYLFFISILSRNELIVVTTFWLLIPCHTFRTNG